MTTGYFNERVFAGEAAMKQSFACMDVEHPSKHTVNAQIQSAQMRISICRDLLLKLDSVREMKEMAN
ncbi:hypothetical protein RBSH_05476 [Rhodopirellula baltica SH28]|uniref:Uncharacterized protein n=1 Tax=Rhodopirellula baltica SH28 TaxID=993517 RepID=K5D8N3_RHOBT|nr:hypothetical protein [Rhodopirellula baltica]EKJ99168.1 hypothetical protein RBSH_05476 [Rhodopirellula baltica SH28]